MRLPVAAAAAFVLSIGCGVLISKAGLIASLLGFWFPFATSAPSVLLNLVFAVVLGVGAYGAIACVLVTMAVCFDLWSIRRELVEFVSSGKAAQFRAGDWHLIFFGAVVEPLGLRLISKGEDNESNFFCLAASFSPGQARREVWKFYRQSLMRCQVWTALGLLVIASLAFSIGRTFETLQNIRPAVQPIIGETALGVVFFIGISCLAAAEVFERFLDTLSSFPFKLESSLRLDLLVRRLDIQPKKATTEFIIDDLPGSDRQASIDKGAALDRGLLLGWVDDFALSLSDIIDQKIARPLQAAEELLTVSGAGVARVDEQLRTISQLLHDGFVGQRQDLIRSIDAAHVNSRDSVQELAAALHALLEEMSQRRLDRPVQNERDRDIEWTKLAATMSDLSHSLETFSASIIPLVQMREDGDERLVAAVERQDQLLEGFNLLVAELTGNLRSVKSALSEERNATSLQPSAAYAASVGQLVGRQMTDSREIVEELYSLLHEFDRSPAVS